MYVRLQFKHYEAREYSSMIWSYNSLIWPGGRKKRGREKNNLEKSISPLFWIKYIHWIPLISSILCCLRALLCTFSLIFLFCCCCAIVIFSIWHICWPYPSSHFASAKHGIIRLLVCIIRSQFTILKVFLVLCFVNFNWRAHMIFTFILNC